MTTTNTKTAIKIKIARDIIEEAQKLNINTEKYKKQLKSIEERTDTEAEEKINELIREISKEIETKTIQNTLKNATKNKITLIDELTKELEIPRIYIEKAIKESITNGTIPATYDEKLGALITIPEEEKEKIAKTIKERGRIKISDLAKELDLTPEKTKVLIKHLTNTGKIKGIFIIRR